MRRPSPPQAQDRQGRDQVDVEQIMRDIRGRIAQRQGIDLSNQQIQDLAARRLESILDPRAIKPSLLDGLKRSAAAPTGQSDKIPNEPTFSFEDTTIYDSHRGALRFARRLFNPLLKLFFNPNPVIQALHLQAKLNFEAVERNAERDRRQTEWNALHYEIVQRLVTEVSRVTLELQALSLRVESLAARVDFNDRRVGTLEGSAHRSRPQGKPTETFVATPPTESDTPRAEPIATPGDAQAQTPDAARRRRRRRRGRRSGTVPGEAVAPGAPEGAAHILAPAAAFVDSSSDEEDERDEAEEALEIPETEPSMQAIATQAEPDPLPEPAAQESPVVLPPDGGPPED
ncbi:MAG: hypothetical protein HOP16_10905 [Acidobacteria bacterium]|nr:hypothetical protein [Acidobacteriota bacterium]